MKRTEFEVLDEPEMIIDEPPMTMSNFFHEPTWDGYSIDTTCGVWAEVDYLLWRRKGRDLPALVTTEPNGGVLPSATILYGNGEVGNDVRPGGRLRLGTFLDRTNCWSLEGSFLMLADSDERFFVDSATTSTIARPFFNLTQDLQGAVVGQDALQVAAPGFATGSLLVTSSSDVWLADALLRTPLCQAGPLTLDFLAGYQAARIDEDLLISSNSTLQNTNATVEIVDSFATENQFHGGVLGLELARVFRRWDVQLTGKVAMGNMRQVVDIQGRQVTTVGNAVSVLEGGLLAQPTNIGTYEREVFAVAPEVAVNLRYHLTCHLEVMAGYSFLAFNRVAQPGDQIDFSVNPNQPPPANEAQRPGFVFRDGDYFLHGVHVGAQWSF